VLTLTPAGSDSQSRGFALFVVQMLCLSWGGDRFVHLHVRCSHFKSRLLNFMSIKKFPVFNVHVIPLNFATGGGIVCAPHQRQRVDLFAPRGHASHPARRRDDVARLDHRRRCHEPPRMYFFRFRLDFLSCISCFFDILFSLRALRSVISLPESARNIIVYYHRSVLEEEVKPKRVDEA
jgi:hypothetical protein